MSSFQFLEPTALPAVSASGTVQLARIGMIAEAHDPTLGYAEFMYVQGAAASAPTAGDLVILSAFSAGQAGTGRTASQGIIGVAPAALSATNVFGWIQIMGACDYAKATNTSTAVGVPIFLGSTLGQVGVSSSATNDTGNRIDGAWIRLYSATSLSNAVNLNLYYPVYNGR